MTCPILSEYDGYFFHCGRKPWSDEELSDALKYAERDEDYEFCQAIKEEQDRRKKKLNKKIIA